jgi:hypothetical protein
MATSEERMRLLKMVEEGKLSPEEAAKLLTLLTESANPRKGAATGGSASEPAGFVPPTTRARTIRIRVIDSRAGKSRGNVDLALPIGLVGVLAKVADRFMPPNERENFNMNEVWAAIQNGATGKLVDVTGDHGERVEIIVE